MPRGKNRKRQLRKLTSHKRELVCFSLAFLMTAAQIYFLVIIFYGNSNNTKLFIDLNTINFPFANVADGGNEVFASNQNRYSLILSADKQEAMEETDIYNIEYVDQTSRYDKNHPFNPRRGVYGPRGELGNYHLDIRPNNSTSLLQRSRNVYNCSILPEEERKALDLIQLPKEDEAKSDSSNKKYPSPRDVSSFILSSNQPSRILCFVYSTEIQHTQRIQAILDTWGQDCDGFGVASTETSLPHRAVHIGHIADESYMNMWQKVRSIWAYIYDHYYQDYDYFHLGGDDMFVIVQNLRFFLEENEIKLAQQWKIPTQMKTTHQRPLFLGSVSLRGYTKMPATPEYFSSSEGFKFLQHMGHTYNTGGPGYTLNRAALKLFVTEGLYNPFCEPKSRRSIEDILISNCFHKFNVLPYDTRDRDNRPRYHHFTPGQHLLGMEDRWYRYRANFLGYRLGVNHSSVSSVAFHNVKDPDIMRALYGYLHKKCTIEPHR